MCDKSQSFGRRGRTSTEVRRNISELWLVFDNTLNTLQFHQNTTLQLYNVYNKCIGDDTKAVTRPNPNCIKKTKQNKIKYGEKRFSTLPMELLNPAMWHVALGSWHWIRQVAAPCNVAGGSGMTTMEFAETSAILEFYIWFRFWRYHRSRHIIMHQYAKFYPNRTTLSRKTWRHVDYQDGGSQPSWILGIQ